MSRYPCSAAAHLNLEISSAELSSCLRRLPRRLPSQPAVPRVVPAARSQTAPPKNWSTQNRRSDYLSNCLALLRSSVHRNKYKYDYSSLRQPCGWLRRYFTFSSVYTDLVAVLAKNLAKTT